MIELDINNINIETGTTQKSENKTIIKTVILIDRIVELKYF